MCQLPLSTLVMIIPSASLDTYSADGCMSCIWHTSELVLLPHRILGSSPTHHICYLAEQNGLAKDLTSCDMLRLHLAPASKGVLKTCVQQKVIRKPNSIRLLLYSLANISCMSTDVKYIWYRSSYFEWLSYLLLFRHTRTLFGWVHENHALHTISEITNMSVWGF